ncbi:hypothetical protein [Acidibrevibacterium fodinaquatile]|jgi:hypothetical protein|nr:hypothetical protein [Acidibrevibacterium fodinaquatile]
MRVNPGVGASAPDHVSEDGLRIFRFDSDVDRRKTTPAARVAR